MTQQTSPAGSTEPSGAAKMLGDFAPALVHFTDDVLFGEVWTRPELSPRDRSLVTVTALAAAGNTEQLTFHLGLARQNGLSTTELTEAITHLAFYAGWPRAMSAMTVAKQVLADTPDDKQGDTMADNGFDQPFPLGKTNDAFAQYFTGQSYNAPLTGGSVPVANITFEPGCRNNWHIHHGTDGGGDQVLLCTAGSGWYQAEGKDPVSMEPGTAIRVPAGTKHWHGAKADSWFSHLAFITPGRDVSNEWLEPVTDQVYGQLPTNRESA